MNYRIIYVCSASVKNKKHVNTSKKLIFLHKNLNNSA